MRQPLSVMMRNKREAKRVSLEQISEQTGIAIQTLYELENDYLIDPRLSFLKRICYIYGIRVEDIDNHDIEGECYTI